MNSPGKLRAPPPPPPPRWPPGQTEKREGKKKSKKEKMEQGKKGEGRARGERWRVGGRVLRQLASPARAAFEKGTREK